MTLRAIAVLVVAVALIGGQLLASVVAERRISGPATTAAGILTRSVAAQDEDDDNGNENDDGDAADDDDNENDGDADDDVADDNDNGDAVDGDDDDDDNDNDDDADDDADDNDNAGDDDADGSDNGDDDDDDDHDLDDNDNAEPVPGVQVPIVPAAEPPPTATPIPVTPTPTPRPTRTPTPTPVPTSEDLAVTTGGDLQLTLTGDRVVVQVFSSTPPGITIRLYLVDPNAHPQTPGRLAGDLIFRIEAIDASGVPLATLPAEVNLSVRYQESDLGGLDDARVMLAWLDPADNQWKPAPRQLADPASRFVAATISNLGVYAVSLP